MKLSEILFLKEDDFAADWEELSSDAASYTPYMFIDARPAEGEDIGQHLPRIVAGPAIGGQGRVEKDSYVARVNQTGTYEFPNPVDHLFVLDRDVFDLFTTLSGREADMEGFTPYECQGDEYEVVKTGPYYLMKKGDQYTRIPASVFEKQFRPA